VIAKVSIFYKIAFVKLSFRAIAFKKNKINTLTKG